MSDRDLFNTPEEEVKRLAEEIRQVKEMLRELSRTVSRIETRVKRAFPTTYPKAVSTRQKNTSRKDEKPSLSSEEAMLLYDRLVKQAKDEGFDSIYSKLSSMSVADLSVLRKELGVTLGKKKPTVKTLVDAVMGRIRESTMLSKHINRGQSLKSPPGDVVANGDEEAKA